MTQHESSLMSVTDQADVQGSPVQLRAVPPAPSEGGQASCDMQQGESADNCQFWCCGIAWGSLQLCQDCPQEVPHNPLHGLLQKLKCRLLTHQQQYKFSKEPWYHLQLEAARTYGCQACRIQPATTCLSAVGIAALLPKAASGYEHPISVWKRRYTVLLVAVIAALLSADQNLLAPNVSGAHNCQRSSLLQLSTLLQMHRVKLC